METNLENLDLEQFLKEMGLSNNNDIKAPYSTGNEDIFETELEDYLLSNYSKTKIENLFTTINNYTKLCQDFEDLFKTNTNVINIELMNDSWNLEQIVSYFNQFTDICLDNINSLCNLIDYTRNKNFTKFKERILTSYKVFKPICKSNIEIETLIDILQVLRNIQTELLTGIGYFAYINKLPIKTIEDRTIALLKYNEEIKTLNKDSFFNLKTNNSIIDLKKRVSLIAINLINDNSISPYIELKLDSESMKTNLNKLMDLYSEFEKKCIVLQNFISEDKSFSYEKAKLAYKATSFGSTEEYLKDLRDSLLSDPTVLKFGAANFVRNSLTVDDKGSPDGQGNSVVATLNDTFKQLCRREFYYAEGNFSIRQWLWSLKDGNRDTRLFIVNTSEQAGAYARYFSLFISLIYKHGLALPNHKTRRIWFILDEIQSLGSGGNQALGQYLISELVNFLAESRSKGFSVTAATQSLPQLEKLIEMEGMRALFQLLSNKFFLQYDEPVGAKFITDFLGSSEQNKTKTGVSKGGQIEQDKLSTNEEEKLKQAVLESELGLLAPLTSYTKLGNFPVCKMEFDYQEPPKSCKEPLIRRVLPFFDQPEDKEALRVAAKEKAREDSINAAYDDIMNMLKPVKTNIKAIEKETKSILDLEKEVMKELNLKGFAGGW